MELKYLEIFKDASLSNFSFLLEKGFETYFKHGDKQQYYSRFFKDPITGLNLYFTFYEQGLDSFFTGSMYSKKKSDSIDLPLFVPFYYPEFPESKFTILFYPGTSIENRINSFCKELSSLFQKKPLSLILNNEMWFEGFFHYPQDQAQGIGWNPPSKKSF